MSPHKEAFKRSCVAEAVLCEDHRLGVGEGPQPQLLSLFRKWSRKL